MMPSAPAPLPTPDTLPFWESIRAHAMKIQYCGACDRSVFYPRSYCPTCHSSVLEWRLTTGKATLASYVINQRPGPLFGEGPMIIALVNLDEGARMMTNLVGVDPDPSTLSLGMRLEVVYEERGEMVLPMFKPKGADA